MKIRIIRSYEFYDDFILYCYTNRYAGVALPNDFINELQKLAIF